jgi:hypothetical protein
MIGPRGVLLWLSLANVMLLIFASFGFFESDYIDGLVVLWLFVLGFIIIHNQNRIYEIIKPSEETEDEESPDKDSLEGE